MLALSLGSPTNGPCRPRPVLAVTCHEPRRPPGSTWDSDLETVVADAQGPRLLTPVQAGMARGGAPYRSSKSAADPVH